VDGLEQTYRTRLNFRRVNFNSSEGQALARYYQVHGHPTIVLIDRAGTPRATIIGVPTRAQVEQEMTKVLE
jgi:hypothetical protein